MSGFVYVIHNRPGGPILDVDSVKIGFTGQKPKTRMQLLQTGNACELGFYAIVKFKDIEMAKQAERIAHWKLQHLRQNGEWFRFNLDSKRFIQSTLLGMGVSALYEEENG